MPLTGLIGFIIVANPDICAQLLPLKKEKEAQHKFLATLLLRSLPSDSFDVPKGPGGEGGALGELSCLARCPQFQKMFPEHNSQNMNP